MSGREYTADIRSQAVELIKTLTDEEVTEVMEIWRGLLTDPKQTVSRYEKKDPAFAAQLAEIVAKHERGEAV